jgi:hypothetical protein
VMSFDDYLENADVARLRDQLFAGHRELNL